MNSRDHINITIYFSQLFLMFHNMRQYFCQHINHLNFWILALERKRGIFGAHKRER